MKEMNAAWMFGRYLESRRKEIGLTQVQVAELISIKRGKYKAKESGQPIALELVYLVASKVYHETVAEFLRKFEVFIQNRKKDQRYLLL